MLDFTKPGMSTTVQDLGRPGHYHLGIPQGGALDRYSAILANLLVGNDDGAAVLECTYMGPVFTTDAPVEFAVTGAPVPVNVNGEERPMWTRIPLEAGDEVSFGVIQGGTRFYLAFAGGVDVPEALGSRTTYGIGRLGGVSGRGVQAGDSLPVGAPGVVPNGTSIPEDLRPEYSCEQRVRVVLGLYDHRLTDEGKRRLLEEEWTLTPVADRTGLRYDGPGVEWVEREQPFGAGQDPSNIVDAGYAVGSIQIPGGKQPIILHRDAVSGGGYAMVATVISTDLDLVARAAPGTKTRFVEVSHEEAVAARQETREALERARRALA